MTRAVTTSRDYWCAAYHTNNSGAPYSATVGNNTENFLGFWRFNQFNFDGEIRQITNNALIENTFPGSVAETNSTRYLRITRTGNAFTFYIKTNSLTHGCR
jgi:hypothetical protein